MTELLYPNGTSYVTINNDPTMNGSWIFKEDGGEKCDGDDVTSEDRDACLKILKEAVDSGEPVPVKPGTKEPLPPPEEGQPAGDGKKDNKTTNALDFIMYENDDSVWIEFPKKGSKR